MTVVSCPGNPIWPAGSCARIAASSSANATMVSDPGFGNRFKDMVLKLA
jgi:hypothetical protein